MYMHTHGTCKQYSLREFLAKWQEYRIWFSLLCYLMLYGTMVLRFTLPDSDFVWVRMCYAVTLSLFYIRFLEFFYVQINIGPKVEMIRRMVRKESRFLLLSHFKYKN